MQPTFNNVKRFINCFIAGIKNERTKGCSNSFVNLKIFDMIRVAVLFFFSVPQAIFSTLYIGPAQYSGWINGPRRPIVWLHQ